MQDTLLPNLGEHFPSAPKIHTYKYQTVQVKVDNTDVTIVHEMSAYARPVIVYEFGTFVSESNLTCLTTSDSLKASVSRTKGRLFTKIG